LVPTPRVATVTALVVGAAAMAILWGSGVELSIYPPPGLSSFWPARLRRTGAVAVVGRPGAFTGLLVLVDFLLSSLISGEGVDQPKGDAGVGPSIASAIRLMGVLTAMVAGATGPRDRPTFGVSEAVLVAP
jgi:hypothetical protein